MSAPSSTLRRLAREHGVIVETERDPMRDTTHLTFRLQHQLVREVSDVVLDDVADMTAILDDSCAHARRQLLCAVLTDIIEHDPSLLVDRPETLFDTCDEAVQWCERLGTRLIELAAEMERRR